MSGATVDVGEREGQGNNDGQDRIHLPEGRFMGAWAGKPCGGVAAVDGASGEKGWVRREGGCVNPANPLPAIDHSDT